MINYQLIDKFLFFPDKGILVVGDLHIGYENSLKQAGILMPERQINDITKEIKDIFKKLKQEKKEIKKIIFIGDIKHAFSFESKEVYEFKQVIKFLETLLPKENIVLIKGNHDTIDYSFEGKMKEFHKEGDIVFIHGNKIVKKAFDKKINFVVMGHLHPSIILQKGAKKETYRCFLTGKSFNKTFIIMPSFLNFSEGTPINSYKEDYGEGFSIIPKKDLLKFEVCISGENKTYNFGKIKDLG
jgi:uncharacterized protein